MSKVLREGICRTTKSEKEWINASYQPDKMTWQKAFWRTKSKSWYKGVLDYAIRKKRQIKWKCFWKLGARHGINPGHSSESSRAFKTMPTNMFLAGLESVVSQNSLKVFTCRVKSTLSRGPTFTLDFY